MKLVLAIVHAEAVDAISQALIEKKYPVTYISSTGGFLHRGNTTIVIGVEEPQVEAVLSLLRSTCGPTTTPEAHAATIFVIEANQFIQI